MPDPHLSDCPLSRSIQAAIRGRVPAADLDEFAIGRATLMIGDHDILDLDDADESTLLGRYPLSLIFQSDGTPASPNSLLAQLSALDEFQSLPAQFEADFGPLHVAFLTRV